VGESIMDNANNFYVYVYIDPRNYEEFYYGKGKGSRKWAHLNDDASTAKAKRIKSIQEDGFQPIVRIIAANLSENEALLVEKTLLWKLGTHVTNISSGHYSDNFRPPFTLNKELPGFDFENSIYFYNVGEGPHRNWDDYRKYGFISAGQRKTFKLAMEGFQTGDIIAAYLKRRGFIGIGRIVEPAQRINDVKIGKKRLLDLKLVCREMDDNCDNVNRSEYVALVEWIRTVDREKAKWESRKGLFTPRLVRASLANQPKTIAFLEKEFRINLNKYIT